MGRKGNCWDNALTESFFSNLKQELVVYLLKRAPDLRQELFEYIEIFYNRQRLHSTNGHRTPEGVEIQFWSLAQISEFFNCLQNGGHPTLFALLLPPRPFPDLRKKRVTQLQ